MQNLVGYHLDRLQAGSFIHYWDATCKAVAMVTETPGPNALTIKVKIIQLLDVELNCSIKVGEEFRALPKDLHL